MSDALSVPAAPARSLRSVTTASRLTMPTAMSADSTKRTVTAPKQLHKLARRDAPKIAVGTCPSRSLADSRRRDAAACWRPRWIRGTSPGFRSLFRSLQTECPTVRATRVDFAGLENRYGRISAQPQLPVRRSRSYCSYSTHPDHFVPCVSGTPSVSSSAEDIRERPTAPDALPSRLESCGRWLMPLPRRV
jgi:hypothetical protein